MKADDFMNRLFGDALSPRSTAPCPKASATTDRPNIKLFMLQVVREFSSLAGQDGLRWSKTFAEKRTGKRYCVSIEIREVAEESAVEGRDGG